MSYINLFYVFIVLAIVLLVLSVALFFALDIPNAIRIVNRKPPKKKGQSVKRSNNDSKSGKMVSVKPDTITTVQKPTQKKKTTVLPNNQTKPKKKTTVLQQNQVTFELEPQPNTQPKKKTTVLQNANTSPNKKTGDMNAKNINNDVFEVIETTAFIASDKTI